MSLAAGGGASDSAASSISPTVGDALASGRRRPRRSAATIRRRKMTVWPTKSSRPSVTKRRTALTIGGQPSSTVTGVKTMKKTSRTTWTQKHPSPGPRSASSSSPLYSGIAGFGGGVGATDPSGDGPSKAGGDEPGARSAGAVGVGCVGSGASVT